nr:NUDIX domain-containing protein [Altericroceibacterium endophyticum]
MPVAAACLRDREGRFLLQQMLPHKRHAGLWEFPGGKIEAQELPEAALAREIHEELGIMLDPQGLSPAGFAREGDGVSAPAILLLLFDVAHWQGSPQGCEGQNWAWFDEKEIETLPMPPMDRHIWEKYKK